MFVQTEVTPNPNSLKFLPGKKVSNDTPIEIINKNESNNELIRNILSINGVTSIFLSDDFLSVNKDEKIEWEDLKHIIISFINDYYSNGNVWSSIWNNFSATGKYTGQKVNFPFHISYKWKGDKIIEEYQFFDLFVYLYGFG